MKKVMIAAATVALAIGAYALPASANDAYFGGTNYLQNGPSSSVPYTSNMDGVSANLPTSTGATYYGGAEYIQNGPSSSVPYTSGGPGLADAFKREDAAHAQW